MNHRICLIIRPLSHVMIVAVLWKTGGVNLTEIEFFVKYGVGSPYNQNRSDKLTKTVIHGHGGQIQRRPYFLAPQFVVQLPKGRALSVIVS